MKYAPTIMGGAIGNCAHIAGVYSYLNYAKKHGCITQYLGPCVSPQEFAVKANEIKPDIICIGYRLNPKNLISLLDTFQLHLDQDLKSKCRLYFGGIPSCVEEAKKTGLFSKFFIGEEDESVIYESLMLGFASEDGVIQTKTVNELGISSSNVETEKILELLEQTPLLRHHFGLASMDDTLKGVEAIAESRTLDIISIAPDQNAQEFFFNQEEMVEGLDSSGGVPLRKEEDLIKIKECAKRGNLPMLKIYAGTNNLVKWAEMSHRLLDVPWGTIPIFWYSLLDGRSNRPLEVSISENLEAIKWYASRGIPVEINDSHQWSLRESSDAVAVASFYISAYVAKTLGVRTYIGQFMFNTPRLTTGRMDIAKMMAKIKITEELLDDDFIIMRQARAGLTHFSVDPLISKGQLAASVVLCRAIRPHIIHVVGFCEADHAATPDEVIESCKIVKGVLRTTNNDFPLFTVDESMERRTVELVKEAKSIIKAHLEMCEGMAPDPLVDPHCLALFVKDGLMDAPQLLAVPGSRQGRVNTGPFNGGYDTLDENGLRIPEIVRIERTLATRTDV